MSYLRTISISTVLFLQPLGSHANSVDQDMQRCVSAALLELNQSANKISVNTSGLKRQDLDHAISGRKVEYRMLVTNKVSGEELGTVTCSLGNSGKLVAAAFDL